MPYYSSSRPSYYQPSSTYDSYGSRAGTSFLDDPSPPVSPRGGRFEDPFVSSRRPSYSTSSRRPSVFDSDRYEVRSPSPPPRRSSRSSRREADEYTGGETSLRRRPAVRRDDSSRYRPVGADLGTYGGDVYDRLSERAPRRSASERVPFSSSSSPYSSRRPSQASNYYGDSYIDSSRLPSNERRPSSRDVREVIPSLRPGSSRSALREFGDYGDYGSYRGSDRRESEYDLPPPIPRRSSRRDRY